MSKGTTTVAAAIHRWWSLLIKEIVEMSAWEWLGCIGVIIVTVYTFYYMGFTFRSVSYIIGGSVMGYMAAYMVYDLWFGR